VYAIIQAGGRQVKVAPGATVQVDGTTGEAGATVTYEQVLFLAREGGELLAGAPFVAGAKVLGVIEGEARGPKIRVFKKKRRKGFRKTRGHRAFYTRVRITEIQG
jgi:large subunit ribosomal protein L21